MTQHVNSATLTTSEGTKCVSPAHTTDAGSSGDLGNLEAKAVHKNFFMFR